jgi:hypothetical protein
MSKEREIIEQQIVDHQKAIDTAQKQLEDLEVTYSAGDRFETVSGKHMIIAIGNSEAVLASLKDGINHNGRTKVCCTSRITPKELRLLCTCDDLVRYWDDRKQVRV